MRISKKDFIEKYGESAWAEHLVYSRNYYKKNKEQCNESYRKWYQANKESVRKRENEHREQRNKQRAENKRIQRAKGYTKYCRVNFDLIENYELAKVDNFDRKKWHLHHRLENYWSADTLKRKELYYNVNPEALIWLPSIEHSIDSGKSIYNPEQTKWHQRKLENE